MQVKKQQLELDMEQLTGSKLGKAYDKSLHCLCLFNLHAEYIIRNDRLNHKVESKLPEEILTASDMQVISLQRQKIKRK